MKKWLIMILAMAFMLSASLALAGEPCPDDTHRYGSWKTRQSATCTRQGHQFKYCQKCDHWEQRWTAKLPHELGEMILLKAPSCTEKGKAEGLCASCGQMITRSVDKLPHEYGDLVVTKEPTCVRNGAGKRACLTCGREKNETIDRLGHDWGESVVAKEPTCLKVGSEEATCLRCGAIERTEIERLAHVYGEWTVKSEPIGKKQGVREAVCTLCGKAVTDRFYAEGTLYEDMEPCEEVIALQTMLKELGYYNGSISTGKFGSLTTTSVARFQRMNGIQETGLADTATFAAIEAAWAEKTGKPLTTSQPTAESVETLDLSEMENAVEALPIGA